MTRGVLIGASAVILLATSSCIFPDVCAGVGAPDVAVRVTDSVTGNAIAAGATLLTYDLDQGGARVDSVVGQSDAQEIWGQVDRRGRFNVVIRKAGYRDWTKNNVVVRDGCPAINTARFTARLVRL